MLLAQLNCAWILERELQKAGLTFRVEPPKVSPRARWADVVEKTRGELREWVPDFMLPYQKLGVLTALAAPDQSCTMSHPTGSGKSLTGITWGVVEPGPIVLVTRASARRTLQREFQRYTTIEPIVLTPRGERKKKDPDPEAQIAAILDAGAVPRAVIVGYETLPQFLPVLLTIPYTSVIFDEVHKLQSHKRYAKVAQAAETGSEKPEFRRLDNTVSCAARLSANAKRRLGLTATWLPDRRRNLWSQLDIIHPGAWGKAWDWFHRYCGVTRTNHGSLDNTGKSNTEELRKRLSFVCHRVDSAETRRMLPPCRRQVLYVTKDQQGRPGAFAQELARAKKIGRGGLREVLLAEAASRKLPVILEYIQEAVASGQKVVIFSARHNDCTRLEQAIQKAHGGLQVWVGHGGHSIKVRDEIRDAYMGRPEDKEKGLPAIPPHPGPCVLVAGAGAFGECLAPDSLVLGENKEIEKYAKGDLVVSEVGLTSCLGMKTRQFQGEMIEVKAQGLLPFAATPNHPVKVLAGVITAGRDRHFVARSVGWRRIEHVTPWTPNIQSPKNSNGDFALVPRVQGKYQDVTFDLTRYVKNEACIQGRRSRGLPDTLTLDYDFAWLLGLYAAEGSAWWEGPTKWKTGESWRAALSLGSHEQVIAARAISILAAKGIKATNNPLPKTNGLNVTIRSSPFALLMLDLMGKGAHGKKIPDEVLFNVDEQIVLEFIKGYALGDGSTNGHLVQTVTVSKVLALQTQLALARLGRLAGITPWKAKKPASIRGRTFSGGGYYIVSWRWQNLRHERFKVYPNFIATPIKQVRRIPYTGSVVDIETEDHTFLAANAIVHNSHNLQDTDLCIHAMLPVNGRDLWQREGRFTRHGQKRPVLNLYPVAEGTIDERMKEILLDKLPDVVDLQQDSNFDEATNDLASSGLTNEQITDSLLDKILGGSEQE